MSLWEWLVGEAGGAWIVGTLGLIVGISQYALRVRPRRLVITEGGLSSVLLIDPAFRDKIVASFEGVQVQTLSQLEATLSNSGNDTISEPVFTVSVPKARVLAADVAGEFGGAKANIEVGDHSVRVKLPYMNARQHRHKVLFRLVVDGSLDSVSFCGGGQGWSVSEGRPKRTRGIISGVVSIAVGVIAVGVSLWGNPDFCGRDMGVLVVMMGCYGVGAAVCGIMALVDQMSDRRRKRMRRIETGL